MYILEAHHLKNILLAGFLGLRHRKVESNFALPILEWEGGLQVPGIWFAVPLFTIGASSAAVFTTVRPEVFVDRLSTCACADLSALVLKFRGAPFQVLRLFNLGAGFVQSDGLYFPLSALF